MILVIYYCLQSQNLKVHERGGAGNSALQVGAWPALVSSILSDPCIMGEGREFDYNSTWWCFVMVGGLGERFSQILGINTAVSDHSDCWTIQYHSTTGPLWEAALGKARDHGTLRTTDWEEKIKHLLYVWGMELLGTRVHCFDSCPTHPNSTAVRQERNNVAVKDGLAVDMLAMTGFLGWREKENGRSEFIWTLRCKMCCNTHLWKGAQLHYEELVLRD